VSISRCLQPVPRPSASLLFVLLAAAATLFSPTVLCAQALLVEDINTAGTASDGYSGFGDDAAVAGLLHFFSADDGLSGREPWVLHLDTGVAERLGDLYPGPTGSSPEQFVRFGAAVLFIATSPGEGKELWVTDGTPGGTVLVEDIAPGSLSSSPAGLLRIAPGYAVFSANDGLLGSELWVTDGTPGGTTMVEDINPGAAGSYPGQFVMAGATLYFRAGDGTNGTELWRWTGGGVSLVVDIEPGAGSGNPSGLIAVGSIIVFSGCTVADGCEPWASDGTVAGTVQLADVHPTDDSHPHGFLWHPGLARLFFAADDGVHGTELWQSVGGVTTRVTDISPGLEDGRPAGLAALATQLVFTGDDGGGGTRLYVYDGAAVTQIQSLSTAGVPSSPRNTLAGNGRIYFYEGVSCWYTDGTAAGTVQWESYCHSSPAFVIGDGRLIYSKSISGERELWSIDSADVVTQETEHATYSSDPLGFAWLGETAFFSADDGVSGRELWVSDGTPEGSELIDLHSGSGASSPAQFTLFEDEIWFVANTPATGYELWRSDGSATGTQPYEIIPGNDSSYPSQMVVLGSSLFVVAYDDLLGEQLFRIADGGSPAVLLDVANESYLSPEELVVAGNRVYFFGSTAATGQELFSVDEDDLEPTPIEIVPGAGDPDALTELVAWNGAPYFVADDGVTGRQIWRSEGVTAVRISNLAGGYSPENLTAGPGGLYFVYDDATLGSEIWRTDGVVTQPVTDIDPLAGDSYPAYLTAVGDRLYFRADDDVTGYELWWTDGSQVVQVADLWPGTSSAYPSDLVAAGDRLVFAADDGTSGRELWITDGALVQRLPEAWPGAAASTPTAVAVDPAATRILYSAFGPTTWREPYRIDLRLFADGFESGNSTAWSATVP
jgi:ELWxxDGT repeat protein